MKYLEIKFLSLFLILLLAIDVPCFSGKVQKKSYLKNTISLKKGSNLKKTPKINFYMKVYKKSFSIASIMKENKLTCISTGKIKIFPVPATTMIYIQTDNTEESVGLVQIYSILGDLIYTKKVKLHSGKQILNVQLTSFNSGYYHCRLTGHHFVYNCSFIVSK